MCDALTIDCDETASILVDLWLRDVNSDILVDQSSSVLIDKVFASIRKRTVGKSRHCTHKVVVLDVANILDEFHFQMIFAYPRCAGEIDLKRWIWSFLLSNHSILELIAFDLIRDDVVKELEEIGLASVEQRVIRPASLVKFSCFSLRKDFLWWLHHGLGSLIVKR